MLSIDLNRAEVAGCAGTDQLISGRVAKFSRQCAFAETPAFYQTVSDLCRMPIGYELFEIQASFIVLTSYEDCRKVCARLF